MGLRVCLAGATGWVGVPLSVAIARAEDLQLVAAVARSARGRRLSEVTGEASLDVPISGSVEEALAIPSDVFVDYTSADVVKGHVLAALAADRHVVVGSSGLSDDEYAEIDELARARRRGVVAVGNFAIAAALLQRFAAEAARHLPSWEILDYASDLKVDAPSGTARELAWRLGREGPPHTAVPVEQTVGDRDSRGAAVSGSRVHSVRLPSYMVGVEAIFGAPDQRLTLRYDAGPGAEPYLAGTLLAIRKVDGLVGLVRGMDEIL